MYSVVSSGGIFTFYLCAVSKEKSGDDVKMTRHDMEPRSNSPTRLGAISSAGVFK